jgi:hypothetical protein
MIMWKSKYKKPLMWILNHMTHLQRAGEAENPAEERIGKWTTEGKVNGTYFTQVSKTQAGVTGRKCVGIFVKVDLKTDQLRWYRRL